MAECRSQYAYRTVRYRQVDCQSESGLWGGRVGRLGRAGQGRQGDNARAASRRRRGAMRLSGLRARFSATPRAQHAKQDLGNVRHHHQPLGFPSGFQDLLRERPRGGSFGSEPAWPCPIKKQVECQSKRGGERGRKRRVGGRWWLRVRRAESQVDAFYNSKSLQCAGIEHTLATDIVWLVGRRRGEEDLEGWEKPGER